MRISKPVNESSKDVIVEVESRSEEEGNLIIKYPFIFVSCF